jgi:uncharacterized protein CbrC (UPF0167 family)
MARPPLPVFKYHPDPISTGSVVRSDNVCACCDQARGYIYTGPAYCEEELVEELCPWCIASGAAHEQLGVDFVDTAGIGGYGDWDAVSPATIEEVAYRTPGFSGMQQERWYTHCGDAAEYVGAEDLRAGERRYNFRCRVCRTALHYTDCD